MFSDLINVFVSTHRRVLVSFTSFRQISIQTVGAHRKARQISVTKIIMVHSDSLSGDESTPAEAAPTAAAFVDTIMEKMTQQDITILHCYMNSIDS